MLKRCAFCNSDYIVAQRFQERSKFCSKTCASKSRQSRVALQCAMCNTTFYKTASKMKNSVHQVYFCSRKCKDNGQRLGGITAIQPTHYNTFSSNIRYRTKALRVYGEKCNRCAYNAYVEMLDVHHINNDRGDNRIENLEVLCVWCHALETRKIPKHQFNQVSARQDA